MPGITTVINKTSRPIVAPRGKPEFNIHRVVDDSGNPGYTNRILIGTATTGLVRVEWVGARYGATLPINWSQVVVTHMIPTYMPLRYQVADAQNMIVKEALYPHGNSDGRFEWLLLLEHDVVIQPDCFVRLNQWMLHEDTPIVSGLYYSRAHPSMPLVFRGRGNGPFLDFEHGDIVYCDGVPTGLLLIHTGILQLMWDESPEYSVAGHVTRRVFNTPRDMWQDPQKGYIAQRGGTSDLEWCTRVMEEDFIRRAGWTDYMDGLEDEKLPFPVDSGIFAKHITTSGEMFP
jgi:hypothetical protein